MVAILLPVLLGMGAFAIDVGYITFMRSQAQAGADAAALAAADELPATKATLDCIALRYATLNIDSGCSLQVTADAGIWAADTATFTPGDTANPNAVQITVRRPDAGLFFGQFLGRSHADVFASAIAVFEHNVSGFRVKDNGPNCSLMPFVILRDHWIDQIVNQNGTDEWTHDKEGPFVVSGRDYVCEIKMYPYKGNTPGNFGTVDIGGLNNATPDLERQILYGPSEEDLQPYGGALELDEETGTVTLNGDTGISAGLKDDLEDIIGLPRTIMLYDHATDSGDTTYYRIVAFVGVTVLEVSLTTGDKHITVQPTDVKDPTAVTDNVGESSYVRHPPQLVR